MSLEANRESSVQEPVSSNGAIANGAENYVGAYTGNMDGRRSYQVATNLFLSFKYAWQGITYTFTTQRNFRLQVAIGMLAFILGLYLQVPAVDFAVICITVAAVLAMELLNTALEAIVDLVVGQTYSELAKIAKDSAAAAVLTFAIASPLVAAFLLLPPLAHRLGWPWFGT